MSLRTIRKVNGFTLIEMLVVIAIIAILAAALFPAITGAIEQAKATALKNKGRSIWAAVITANAEREPLSLASVWPGDLPGYTSTTKATDYFKFLMGMQFVNGALLTTGAGDPICEDLKLATLTGAGATTASSLSSLGDANCAWYALNVCAATNSAEDAFIFTKNIGFASLSAPLLSTTMPTGINPGVVNIKRGVFVTFGGSCIDLRAKYLASTNWLVGSTNTYMIFHE